MRHVIIFVVAFITILVCGAFPTEAAATDCNPRSTPPTTCYNATTPTSCDGFTLGTSMMDGGGKNIVACLNKDSGVGKVWKAMTAANAATPAPTVNPPPGPVTMYTCPFQANTTCGSIPNSNVTCHGQTQGAPTCMGCGYISAPGNPYAQVTYGALPCTKIGP